MRLCCCCLLPVRSTGLQFSFTVLQNLETVPRKCAAKMQQNEGDLNFSRNALYSKGTHR